MMEFQVFLRNRESAVEVQAMDFSEPSEDDQNWRFGSEEKTVAIFPAADVQGVLRPEGLPRRIARGRPQRIFGEI
jgi:hypothetical protein